MTGQRGRRESDEDSQTLHQILPLPDTDRLVQSRSQWSRLIWNRKIGAGGGHRFVNVVTALSPVDENHIEVNALRGVNAQYAVNSPFTYTGWVKRLST